jgi:uncharacterized membrane protein
MNSFRSKLGAPAEYATCSDFRESLLDNLTTLYVLAFVLTGNHTEAEQCFVATVQDTVIANSVFKGWERSWSKRSLIINAIRHVFRGPIESTAKQHHGVGEVEVPSPAHDTINAVARLASPIQRFVFVISVLEGYSEHECALLLGSTSRDVRKARIDALWQLSGLTAALARTAG